MGRSFRFIRYSGLQTSPWSLPRWLGWYAILALRDHFGLGWLGGCTPWLCAFPLVAVAAVVVSMVAAGLTCIICPGKLCHGGTEELNDYDSGSDDDETGCCCVWGRSHGRSESRDVTVHNSPRMLYDDDDDYDADAQYMQGSRHGQYRVVATEQW